MEPTSAMQIKEILRLRLQLEKSERETGAHCGVSKGAVGDYTRLASKLGITWASIEQLSETQVWELFGKSEKAGSSAAEKRQPDWHMVYMDLCGKKSKGGTLRSLWEEYWNQDPATAYKETQFREHYLRYKRRLDIRMRCEHCAGEKLWIDYAGMTMPIWRADLSEIDFKAEIFVSVMGVSSYTFAEATRTQGLEDFIRSNERAFRFMNAAPHVLVPDNLKSAVTKADRHAPVINRTFLEFAQFNGCIVQPARAGKPRDKAKVENGVLLVERWILFRLRNQKFTSLEALNEAIAGLIEQLNNRRLRNLPYTRKELFEKVDRPAMLAYKSGYSFGHFVKAKVNPQYHVRADGKYYSVPFQHVGKSVWARVSTFSVEVFFDDIRIALHDRLRGEKVYSTKVEHMPPNHAAMVEESAEKIYGWARSIGPKTLNYIDAFLTMRRNAYTAHGHAKGVLMLARTYGNERLEAACERARELNLYSKDNVERILKRGRDQTTAAEPQLALPQEHANVRGAEYYQ